MQGLRKFLRSPYFNQREDVVLLFDFLVSQIPKKRPELDKVQIHKSIFPDKPYQDREFHLIKTYLLKLVEQYLVVRYVQHDPIESQFILMRYYQERQLFKHFETVVNRLHKRLEAQPRRDNQYFERKRDIFWEEYQLAVMNKPGGDLPLHALSEITDVAYFTQKLRQLCFLSAQQIVYTAEYSIISKFKTTFFGYLEEQNLLQIPAIGLYYHGYFVLNDANAVDNFKAFKLLLFEHYQKFNPSEARELFLLAINFCVKKVNAGDTAYFEEMLNLYKRGLIMETLLENGKLSRFAYHNIVATAIQVKAFDWASQFVQEYQSYLAPKYQESSYQFNQARLSYEQGDYQAALGLIHNAVFPDVLLNLSAKTISLKIYFALQEFDILNSHLDAMMNFIRRNKGLGYHRDNYLNLTRYTKKLLNLNHYDKAAVAQFKLELSKEEILTEKAWLLAQLSK